MRILLVLGCLGFVGGCGATLSSKDCATTDWSARGQADALAGEEIKQFYDYQKTCAGAAIKADEQAYVAGYMEGQKEFCTEDMGFKVGLKGSKLKNVCPSESKYYQGYLAGIKEYSERHEKRSADSITRGSGGLSAGPSGGP
jgi:hypothetical protein